MASEDFALTLEGLVAAAVVTRANACGAAAHDKNRNIPIRPRGPRIFIADILMPQNRRGVRIFSEGLGVAVGEYFHEPMMEIIHGMVVNRAEAAIVFLAGFVEIAAQSAANVFLLASDANIFRPEQFDVLHGDFGHTI